MWLISLRRAIWYDFIWSCCHWGISWTKTLVNVVKQSQKLKKNCRLWRREKSTRKHLPLSARILTFDSVPITIWFVVEWFSKGQNVMKNQIWLAQSSKDTFTAWNKAQFSQWISFAVVSLGKWLTFSNKNKD